MPDHAKALEYARLLNQVPMEAYNPDVYQQQVLIVAQAYLDLHQRMQWQPIESAPRDGTKVLVGRKDCKPEIQSRKNGVPTSGGPTGWDFRGLEGTVWKMPTHWMPLPLPPTQEKEGE